MSRSTFLLPILAVFVAGILSAIFIVDEREKALVLQFGRVVAVKEDPGIAFKIPLIPEVVRNELAITAYFGGTSILIIVSVGMDTVQQIRSHLLAHQYEGLIEKSQLRGKKRGRTRGTARR